MYAILRLVRVTFKYDPLGRRIYKSSSCGASVYVYDGDNLIEETNSSGTSVARYTQGENIDEPLAMFRTSTTSFYEADGLGSITSLSSAAGALTQTYGYDSFGKQTSSSGSLTNSFQFTGRELDPETSLQFLRARYYDPATGGFLSEDPLRFFSGQEDFYGYAEQNPVNLIDPFGLKCKCSYSQSTGHLKCVDSDTGKTVAEANGYAGKGAGKNNPDMQDVPFVGPLPRGNYSMGPARNSPNTGPLTIPLNYIGGDDPFPANRSPDLMRIHGDRKGKPPGNASEGCIVTPTADSRKKIADNCGKGSTLTVGP